MSLLTIVQDACNAIGFPSPTSVVSNPSDQTAQQAWRLANLAGKALYRRHPWQALHKEYTFTLSDGVQEYALPADYGYVIHDTTHNRSEQWQVAVPVTAQSWQQLKAQGAGATINMRGRIRGEKIEFYDSVGAGQDGQTIALEYISNHWCESSVGARLSSFAADSDVALLDEHLILLDVIWRLKNAKGIDFDVSVQEFNLYLRTAMAQDGARRTLSMHATDPRMGETLNIPETGYGL